MFSLKNQNKESLFIVLDIGSASVGGAIVSVSDNNQIPKIIYDNRVSVAYKNNKDDPYFSLAMFLALKNVVTNIEQDGIRKLHESKTQKDVKDINKIFCVFSPLWYMSTVETFKFNKEEPFTVSDKFISDILKKADEKFLESVQENKFNTKNKNLKLIEKDIVQVSLNGYRTEKPYGKKANTADITLFMSAVSEEIFEKTKEILEKTFNIDDMSFHTFTLSSFSTVRDIFNTEKNFLLMDIEGETTNILLAREGTMIKEDSFPFGKNILLKKVAKDLNTSSEEAHSLLRLSLEEKNTDIEYKKLNLIIKKVREEWLSFFRKILLDFSEGLFLPKTIFLTVDSDIGKWFIDTIKSDEFSMHTIAEEPFTVVELNSRILSEYSTSETNKNSASDPFLTINAIFANKIKTQ